MKNLLLPLLILSSLISAAQTSDQYTFKLQYKPNKRYRLASEQKDTAYLVQQKYNGENIRKDDSIQAKTPYLINNTKSVSIIRTGAAPAHQKEFPYLMDILQSETNGDTSLWNGARIYGHCELNHWPVLDSISPNMAEGVDGGEILKYLQATLAQFPLAEHHVKIGESFTELIPVDLPSGGPTPINISMANTYTLTEVRGEILFFDTYSYSEGTQNNTVNTIKMKLTSSGKMQYHSPSGYYIFSSSRMYMNSITEGDGVLIEIQKNSTVTQTIEITDPQ